ncbi:hypothetical protein [Amycolatopsis echigonensis]|uniref:Uncharacterized protein n=1 Tax=Amycolatopsis echigonensis TaxID=2576905 RepID=A0A8E1VY01_9PSEU|nr:hypothetical protein [Amycolatopsis echigonensis]MBB2500454.1 hypothetical protein [Amycolatopsis echigonensis]
MPRVTQAHLDAEAFVAFCDGCRQQLAVRGDLDPAPFAAAILAAIES